MKNGNRYYIHRLLKGNRYGCRGTKSMPNKVNLEYSPAHNIGDTLSPLIVDWMLSQKGINPGKKVKKTKHLFAVGSLLGRGSFDSTVWGSGILRPDSVDTIHAQSSYRKYDIRAVRGPVTRGVMIDNGYECPEIYGDPAIVMPEIYPGMREDTDQIGLILHHATDPKSLDIPAHLKLIDPITDDYKAFIDGILACEYVVSSSLHGIILAESYGVPAVFLMEGEVVAEQLMKFKDWYYSTNRDEFAVANSVEEALECAPMPLPDLSELRKSIKNAFPYDLWDC